MSDAQEPTASEPLPVWYWLFMPAGAGLILLVIRGVGKGVDASAWPLGVAVLIGYFLLSGIVWRVGDWLRLIAMPTAFLSQGFLDTLRIRVFWAIGPQVFGLLFLALAGCFILVHWGQSAARRNMAPAARSEPAVADARRPGVPSAEQSQPNQVMAAASDCSRPEVLALVRDEVHGALVLRIRMTHGVDLDMAQVQRMVRIDLGKVEETERTPNQVVCAADFTQHADATAMRYGLTTVHDPELTYWIERDASGNLQVGVGD